MRVLEGKMGKGLVAPYSSEVCDPLREELKEKYGIDMVEETVL